MSQSCPILAAVRDFFLLPHPSTSQRQLPPHPLAEGVGARCRFPQRPRPSPGRAFPALGSRKAAPFPAGSLLLGSCWPQPPTAAAGFEDGVTCPPPRCQAWRETKGFTRSSLRQPALLRGGEHRRLWGGGEQKGLLRSGWCGRGGKCGLTAGKRQRRRRSRGVGWWGWGC